jgi:ABC-type sugar transport system ATPase subunit
MADVLRAENISKSFPGVLAVDDVSFSLNQNEVLALVGENGAGKSTLSLILSGVLKPDDGQILLEGNPVSFSSSHAAIQSGISMVFQELSLVGGLSVAENIFANRQPSDQFGMIKWRDLIRQTEEFISRFNLLLGSNTLVKNLSMGQQQILEILKAISTNPKVLILDEPTSSLTESETEYLFENIRKLQKEGISVIYITHKLPEVFQIADRVMVMRDGKHVGTRPVNEVTEEDLIGMMVGRQIQNMYGSIGKPQAENGFFRVEGLTRKGVFEEISFSLNRGEILGFAGLVGAGRTEVGRAIFGIDPCDDGRIVLEEKEIRRTKPLDTIKNGIVYITEDRKGQGLFLNTTIRENMIAPSLWRMSASGGFLPARQVDNFSNELVKRYDVVTTSIYKKILNLSGGNQQKCLIAMWMGTNPKIIIFDEPTRGVDVGARSEIYQKLRGFAEEGTGVIMISSDLPELIGMCDRIIVMHKGKIMGEVFRKDFSEEKIMAYAAGIDIENSRIQALRGKK